MLWRACNLIAFTQFHWSSGPPVCFPSWGTQVQSPRGVLMWNWDSPVSVILLHWWPRCDWSFWPHLRWASFQTITRLSCQQCDYPTCYHATLLPRFYAHCRSSFRLHNRQTRLLGEALWRACNLTAFTDSTTGLVVHPFASRHEGSRFNPKGGTYVEPGFSW